MDGKTKYLNHQICVTISLLCLFLLFSSCAGLREKPAGIKTTMTGRAQDVRAVDSVDLKGSFRGKVYLGNKKIRFSGIMAVSEGSKARFELFSPLGRTVALFLLSDNSITFYLSEQTTLWKGSSSSENLFKIFGMKMSPEHIMQVLTGVAQFHAALGRGDYVIDDVEERECAGIIHTLHEFRDLLLEKAKILMSSPPGKGEYTLHVLSLYDMGKLPCESFVPSRCIVYEHEEIPIIEIAIEEVNEIQVHANGTLFCNSVSSAEHVSDNSAGDDIYNDLFLYEIPGVKVVDLDAMERTEPVIGALYE